MLRGAYIPVWSKRTARCIVVTYWPPRRQFRRASFSSHRSLPAPRGAELGGATDVGRAARCSLWLWAARTPSYAAWPCPI
jgi:hypothetical protein